MDIISRFYRSSAMQKCPQFNSYHVGLLSHCSLKIRKISFFLVKIIHCTLYTGVLYFNREEMEVSSAKSSEFFSQMVYMNIRSDMTHLDLIESDFFVFPFLPLFSFLEPLCGGRIFMHNLHKIWVKHHISE